MLVSIIIPVIRPEKAQRCIAAIREKAGIPEKDAPKCTFDNAINNGYEYEIITEEDKHRIGVTKMVKRLTDKSKGEMVCFIGDDCIPRTNFLKNAIRAMEHIPDGWGLVSFNDNPTTTRSAAHWLAHKKLLPLLDGEFFHTGYQHCFCDDELLVRCQQMNRYIYAYDAFIYHEHPLTDPNVQPDESFKKVHNEETYEKDHALFNLRMAHGWTTPKAETLRTGTTKAIKVAIGIPSGDLLHAEFAMSLVNLCIHSISRGIHVAIINQKGSLLEISRNQIVQSAFEINADYLLTLDSDMVFPAATLQRLLSHKKDIVCADATRRRDPIETVLIGLDGKKLNHENSDKSSPLIPVKGGSNAVCLMNMNVFRKIKPPHYLVQYNQKTGEFLSEDFYFTNVARQAGFTFYCDSYLSQFIGHTGAKTYYLKDVVKQSSQNPV